LKNRGRTDPTKIALIRNLRGVASENNAPIWKKLALELSKANRNRVTVNLSRLNRHYNPENIILVPGKVLGSGIINKSLVIAAESFSDSAREKILNSGGSCLTIEELIEKDPKGSKVRLFK